MSPVLTFLLAAEHILNLKMLHAQYNDDEEGDDDDDGNDEEGARRCEQPTGMTSQKRYKQPLDATKRGGSRCLFADLTQQIPSS